MTLLTLFWTFNDSLALEKGFPTIVEQGHRTRHFYCTLRIQSFEQPGPFQCKCCKAMLDWMRAKRCPFSVGRSGTKIVLFTRETVADTDPVQQKGSWQNLAEELTAPRASNLECIGEAEIKSICQGWGAAFESDIKSCVDVTTDNSKLSPKIFITVISQITTAFNNRTSPLLDCSLASGFINQFFSAAV